MENKAIVQRFVEEVWHAKRFHMIDELCSTTFLLHGLPSSISSTREGVKQVANAMHHGFPDIHFTIEDMIEEQSKGVIRWNSTATHQDNFMGITVTNKLVRRNGIAIYRVQKEKIVEWWNASDMLPVLVQLGAIKRPFS